MNKHWLIAGIASAVLLGLVVGLWLIWKGSNEGPHSVDTPHTPQAEAARNTAPTPVPSSQAPMPFSPAQAQKTSEAQVQHQNDIFEMLFLTPIVFYGKVVDQNGVAVSGANAALSPAQSQNGSTTVIDETSDHDGLFSVTTHGLGIAVTVTKTGYYSTTDSGGVFGYLESAGSDFKPHSNPEQPAVFVLRKAGETEPLVMIHRDVKISKDGTPVQINLTTGATFNVTAGDIKVQAWTHDEGILPNHHQPYDWRCVVTVPGGGLQPRTGGEFDFEAPADGYQATDTLDMPATATPWSRTMNREYFLKLANGDYARINFTMRAGGAHFFSITSYLNPQPGHRNLEANPDPTKSP